MDLEIRHDEENRRFVAPTAHGEATLDYEVLDERTLDYRSTFVPPEDREEGTGETLVLHALDWARHNGWEIVPTCRFVRSVLERHDEYSDIVAARR